MSRLVCTCGHAPDPTEPWPFACPERGDGREHVIHRVLHPAGRHVPSEGSPNPFLRYAELLHSTARARAAGWSSEGWAETVAALDAAVREADRPGAPGFRVTPCASAPALSAALGLQGRLWCKDETGNVAGSHKARHLFGLALHLLVGQRLDPERAQRPLAIASCGNAALAAAVVARGLGRALEVFVPPDAAPPVLERLGELGARVMLCPRRPGERGDPCYLRFREAVASGAVPFCCQGPDNGLAIEGGLTLGYELVTQILVQGGRLDRVFVQVGGGALCSAVAAALQDCVALGLLDALPKIHPVQTAACYPLARAWRRVAEVALGTPPEGEAATPEEVKAWVTKTEQELLEQIKHGPVLVN